MDKLPIIADIPNEVPGLGFQESAEVITAAVRGGDPPQFTIGLYGPWGSGKSTLLKAIERNLKPPPKKERRDKNLELDVIPVFFDAWRYEKSEYIIVPLLHCIYSEVLKHTDKKRAEPLARAIRSFAYSLNFNVGGSGLGLRTSAKDMVDYYKNDRKLTELDQAFSKPFDELKNLPNALGKDASGKSPKIAVLIDDLDRCKQNKVVSVLESINIVTDVEGFIFILALDYDVLVAAIEQEYRGISGDSFIRKIVQLPFRVPPLYLNRDDFLIKLIPEQGWQTLQDMLPSFLTKLSPNGPNSDKSLTEAFANQVLDIAVIGLDRNPRQIKRLINSFLLVGNILPKRNIHVDWRFLMSLIGFQLQWPSHYLKLQETVLKEESPNIDLSDHLLKEAGEDAQPYARRFLVGSRDLSQLQQIFQFARVVTETEGSFDTKGSFDREEAEKFET